LSIVTVRKSGVAAAPMMSAAVVFNGSCSRISSSRSRPRVRSASARCSCTAICAAASSRFSSSFSVLACLRPMYPLHSPRMPEMPPDSPRCSSEKTPKVTDSSTGTPVFEFTCAEMSRTCATITAMNR
jgi:hypothetical protein